MSGGDAGGGEVPRPRRLQFNPEALKLVDASRRKFWEQMAVEVEVELAGKFRKRWTDAETARVVLAEPSETYEDLGRELGRSPGAVRYRRMAMVHLLREEHGAPQRVTAYEEDPKANHKHHDYFQVHRVLQQLGMYDRPVAEQFELAQPLSQPTASWRGDGSSAVAGSAANLALLRSDLRRLLQEARDAEPDDCVG